MDDNPDPKRRQRRADLIRAYRDASGAEATRIRAQIARLDDEVRVERARPRKPAVHRARAAHVPGVDRKALAAGDRESC